MATNGCQWLQGIVPIFGNGWDPNSFQANGRPVNAVDPTPQYTGNWAWYAEDQITYKWDSPFYSIFNDPVSGRKKICSHLDPNCINTGVVSGEGMPAGWYAYSPGNQPCCMGGGDPNFGYGDGAGCTIMGGWTVDFTLTAREFAGSEGCDETDEIDLSVQIFTFADGEVGCYSCSPLSNSGVCAEDFPSFASRTNQCCEGPMLIPEDTEICSGGSVNISLMSDQDGAYEVTYSWTVDAPPTIVGASPGSGETINQTLTNTGTSPGVVTYTITPVNDVGCLGDPSEIYVTVLPEVEAEAYTGPEPIEGCAGASTITLGGSPTGLGGNGGPYTYQWNNGLPGVSNPEVSPNTSTTFRVTVTDGNGCTAEDEVEVVIAPAVLFDIIGDTILCEENTPSPMEVVPLTGTAPYDIEWDGPDGFQTGAEAQINAAGNYELIVTDANGCTGAQTFSIDINATPDILFTNIDNIDTLCGLEGPYQYLATGISDGNIFFYNWATPVGSQSGEVVEINGGGNYVLTVTDNLGCVATDSFFIPQFPLPEPEILGSDEICSGATASLQVTDTFALYNWSTGADSASSMISGPGTYSITVTADSGCEGVDSFSVDLDLSSNADAGPDQVLTCLSDTVILNGTASSSGAEFLVRWETINGNIRSGRNSYTPVVDQVGEYLVFITNTDTDCEAIDTVSVTIDTLAPAADAGPDQTLTCSITSTILEGTPSAPPGFTTAWSAIEGSFSGDPNLDSIRVEGAGLFELQVTNPVNGCASRDTARVFTDDDLPNAQAGPDGFLDCEQLAFTADGTNSDTGSLFRYQWTTATGQIDSNGMTLAPTFSADGWYALQVTDTTTDCSLSDTLLVVDRRDVIDVSLQDSLVLSCVNDTQIIQPVYDTAGYYEVFWMTQGGEISGDTTAETLTVAVAGEYTIEIRDPLNRCDTILSIQVVSDQEAPFADAGSDGEIDCNQTSVTLDGSNSAAGPQIEYEWVATQGGAIQSGSTTTAPVVTTGGEYILLVTDTLNGCVGTDTATVTVEDGRPEVSPGPDRRITCDSTTVQITADVIDSLNVYVYNWTAVSGNIIDGQNEITARVDAAGTYEFAVLDTTNSCETTVSLEVTQDQTNPDIIAGYTDSIICDRPDIWLDATGSSEGANFNYEWTTLDGNILSAADSVAIQADADGSYNLQILNSDNGCSSSEVFTIIEDRVLPTVNIAMPQTLTCSLEEVQLLGTGSSTGNEFSYQWTTTEGRIISGQEDLAATVNEPGDYYFAIRNDRNNCAVTDSITVIQDIEEPVLELNPFDELNCTNTSIVLDAGGSTANNGLVFYWTLPDNSQVIGPNESQISASLPGQYQLSVADDFNSCVSDTVIQVSLDTMRPQIDLPDSLILTCDQQQLDIRANVSQSGSNPDLSWTAQSGNILGNASGLSIEVDAAGWYICQVINNDNGCFARDSVEVELDENLPVIVFEDPDTINCRNQTIVLSAAGSSMSPSIEYTWTGPSADAIISDSSLPVIEVNAPGVYELTLFDSSNNCEATAQIEVFADQVYPTIEIDPADTLNCGIEDIVLSAVNSSTGPRFSYEWGTTASGSIDSGVNTLNPTISRPGIYTLDIVDTINGCGVTESVRVVSNVDLPEVDAGDDTNLTCTDSVRTLSVNATTDGNWSAVWRTISGNILNDAGSARIQVNAGGLYLVEVVDSSNLCTNFDSVQVIDDSQLPQIDIASPFELSCQREIVSLEVNVEEDGDYIFQWTTNEGTIIDGANSAAAQVEDPGRYKLKVENSLTGCIAVDSVDVRQVENDFQEYTLQLTDPLCIGDERGCVRIDTIRGGTPPYRMSINGNLFIPADREPCNIPIGENTIVLQDANGCEIEYSFSLNPPENYLVDLGEDIVIRSPSAETLDYKTDLPQEIITGQEWFLNDSLFCRGCENVIIDVSEEYLVNLKLFYADGDCFIEDLLHIRYIDELDIFVPNIFTPNGDGRNDYFTIFGDHKLESIRSLQIFERWGTQLWEGRSLVPGNEPQGWDGTYQGKTVQPGVYVYSAEILLKDGSTKRLHGTVTVSR
jgi:gliding motility-associated-like protein